MDNDFAVPGTAYVIAGDRNVVRDNTITGTGDIVAFGVSGIKNTLDSNILANREAGPSARVGIDFTADGNYDGNNRMAATVAFNLNGTVRTVWGQRQLLSYRSR